MQRENGRTSLLFLVVLLLFVFILPALSFAQTSASRSSGRIAILPFDNLTTTDETVVVPPLMDLFRQRLEQMRYDVISDADMYLFLARERVRSTGFISKDIAKKLYTNLKADLVLVGVIFTYTYADNPSCGLSARLVDTTSGQILWADVVSGSGDDFKGIFEIGRITSMDGLFVKLVDIMFKSFKEDPPLKEREMTYRLAVMPFLNKSRTRDAGMIATHIFIAELFKSRKFEPVEFGDVRSAVIKARIRYKGEIDFSGLAALADGLAIDGVLVGTVDIYSDGKETFTPPSASVSARLLDTRTNRVVWLDNYTLGGDDNIFILDLGRISTVDGVARYAAAKLVKGMEEKAVWK